MSSFAVKGWCPDAWHPMMAGDGLLVRVKPRLGRLTRAQVLGLCDAAVVHGNGLIDMTARARMYADPRTVRETDYVEPLRLEIERYIQKRLEVPMPANSSPRPCAEWL